MEAPPETRFRWLQTGRQFVRALLGAIHRARRSLRLEFYIFAPDETGRAVRDALVAAARRKLEVRVLVDALGSKELPAGFWQPLLDAGGTVRRFNPLKLDGLFVRDHRKIVVVDEELVGLGGFNVADEYGGDGLTTGWADLGIGFRSGAAAQFLAREFDRMFSVAERPQHWFARLRRGQRPPAHEPVPGLQVLLSGPGRSPSAFQAALRKDLHAAREVALVSAYFLPTFRQRKLLREAARRGGGVRIIVPGKSDVALSQNAARHLYPPLLRAGVEIYEYEPQILHAKLMVVDGAAYVGSSNLDTRSLHINYEVMLRLTDPTVVNGAREIFERLLSRSQRVDPALWRRSRTWLEKIRGAVSFWLLARADPYVTRWLLQQPR